MGDNDFDNDTIASLPRMHTGDDVGGGSGGVGGGGSVENSSLMSLDMTALNLTVNSDATPTATAPATARSNVPGTARGNAGGGGAAKKPRAWKGSVSAHRIPTQPLNTPYQQTLSTHPPKTLSQLPTTYSL